MNPLFALFRHRSARKVSPARKTTLSGGSAFSQSKRLRLEPLEQRNLLTVSIPLLNSDFEQPTWVNNGGTWVQQAVAPGTIALNYNELDPRFGPPGYAKTAEGGAGPGPNGEGQYNEFNATGNSSYFNLVNGQLPAPASGTNFFLLNPAPGGTYHFMVDQQPNTTVDAGNHGDINYPPMIAATVAHAGETYQATVALGNPLVNASNVAFPNVELDLTLGAGSYYTPSYTNSYNYTTGATNPPQPGDTGLNYQGYGTTIAAAFSDSSQDPSWHLAPGTFKDLTVTWTCPPQYDGMPLDIQIFYHGVSVPTAMDNIRLVDITALPAAPTAVAAAAASTSQVNVSWTDTATNVTGFQIDQSTTPDFSSGVTTATVPAAAPYYSATGLSASTTYYYRVRAYNGAGVSANTATVNTTTGSGGTPVAVNVPDGNFAADSPGNVINSNTGGNVTFTQPMTGSLSGWTFSANPSTAQGGYYANWEPFGVLDNVTSGNGAGPLSNNAPWLGNQPGSSYNAFMYYPGEQYTFNSVVGGAQPGASLTMTTTGINTTAASGTTYTATIQYGNVSWASAAANHSANVAFNILVGGVVVSSSHFQGLAQGAPWTPLTVGWVADAAHAGQPIQLQVVATNFLEGPTDQWQVPTFGFANTTLTAAAPQGTAPAAPSGLSANAASTSQINLSWTDNSNNETGFKIDQATNSTFTSGLTTVAVAANAATYNATGLSAGTTYYYRVRATNAVGDSANSNTASATTQAVAPAAPSGLTATAFSTSQINLSWTDNSNNETGFKIDQATNSTFTSGLTTVTVAANATTYSATGLSASTTYYYRVRATNAVGDSANSNTASATTPVAPPAAPSGLTASAASASQINLSWTDNSSNETGFKIDQATSSDFAQNLTSVTVAANATTYNATGLASGTTYYYRVRSTNAGGDSANSNSASATTQGVAPAAPSGLTATAVSTTQINLSWTDNSNNETGFAVDQATNSTFTTGLSTSNVGANIATYSATGLAANSTYYYRVRAVNGTGNSANTATASATTLAGGAIAIPDGDFTGQSAGYVINTNSGSGTYTSPLNATLAGWAVTATPTTANGGTYSGWQPYAVVDNITSNSGASPFSTNAIFIGNQPAASYNAFVYYPGEIYNSGSVVGGAQPNAKLTMTTTGISANAIAGNTYSATILAANASWSNAATNPGANVTLNILANGVVVGTGTLSGLAQGSPWTAVTATWTAGSANAGQAIQLQILANNFLEGPSQWQVPTFALAHATLSTSVVSGLPTAPSNLTATGAAASQINLSWTDNSNNESGFVIDQATNSTFTSGLTTATVAANATSYQATGLVANSTYYYRVRALNATGSSATTATVSASTTSGGTITIPDGDFTGQSAAYVINSNTGGGLTFTSPMNATLAGWSISAKPSTGNGGTYAGWEPYGLVDNITSNNNATPFSTNAVWLGNQPAANYNAFIYYPGELYNSGSVVGGAQPNAKLTMTTTGISANAVAGNTYTATIQVANSSWSNSATNPGANVTLNILAGGVVVGTGTLSGLAQGSPWTPVTATWTATSASAGQTLQLQVVANNFLEGPGPTQQWQVPTLGLAHATLLFSAPVSIPVPDGNFASDAPSYVINANTGGGTYSSPLNATLAGWSVTGTPSTGNGGNYNGWQPYAVVDSITTGSAANPFNNNTPWVGNQPGSSYNALFYYPGELYNWGSVVGGAQPNAKLTMTTTGISASAIAGNTYTATIQVANASWSNSATNPSANVTLNILANGVVVGTGSLSGLAQGSPWTPVTATWTATSANAGQAIQLQVSANNFLEGPGGSQQWQVPTFGLANATLTMQGGGSQSGSSGLPTAPNGLTATAASSSQINLSWADNSNNETGFKVDQSTTSDFSSGVTTTAVAANVSTYQSTGLTAGTTYYYRVRATNASGDSANSNTANAATQAVAPAAPSGLTAAAFSTSQINLSWTDNSNNETGFKIDQATDSTFTSGLTTVTVAANATTYSATGLSAGTTYYYRVRATNAVGDSANSSSASAATQSSAPAAPAAPSNLAATVVASSQTTNYVVHNPDFADILVGDGTNYAEHGIPQPPFNDGWFEHATTTQGVEPAWGYWNPSNTQFPGTSDTFIPPATITLGNLPSPATGTQYCFFSPGSDLNTVWTLNSERFCVSPPGTSAATFIAANTAYTGTVAVGNPLDTGAPDYTVVLFTQDLTTGNVLQVLSSTTIHHQDIAPGTFALLSTTYVSPASGGAIGQALGIEIIMDHFTAKSNGVAANGVVTNFRVSSTPAAAQSNGQINLTWTDNSNNESGFKIDQSTTADFSSGVTTVTTAANVTSYPVTGLTVGTKYYFRVRSVAGSSESGNSSAVSATAT